MTISNCQIIDKMSLSNDESADYCNAIRQSDEKRKFINTVTRSLIHGQRLREEGYSVNKIFNCKVLGVLGESKEETFGPRDRNEYSRSVQEECGWWVSGAVLMGKCHEISFPSSSL